VNGRVASFDDPRGIGSIVGDDGVTYPFHCTQIADGSRTIGVEIAVTFEPRAWHLGRCEATAIVVAPSQ
jgi:hypothetical protein